MLASLKVKLDELINHDCDQILFVNLGRDDESTPFSMETLGIPRVEKSRVTII